MLSSARTFFGTEVDNSSLVLFRMVFGLLAAAESFGAIFTGWVHETFIEPSFTFTVIGFEWLQPLSGDGMIYYFIVMGVAGLCIMLGLFYRASTFVFADCGPLSISCKSRITITTTIYWCCLGG